MDIDVLQAANPCHGQGATEKKLQEERARENGKEDDKEKETQQEKEEEQETEQEYEEEQVTHKITNTTRAINNEKNTNVVDVDT